MDERRQRLKDPLGRRVDQWIQTGRQFVDGVAGNRPGSKKFPRAISRPGNGLNKMGQWMEDRLDSFLEEDDVRFETSQMNAEETDSNSKNLRNKRPLDAISRRLFSDSFALSEANEQVLSNEEWPDDRIFKVDRWQRNSLEKADDRESFESNQSLSSQRRPLPRSNRQRKF